MDSASRLQQGIAASYYDRLRSVPGCDLRDCFIMATLAGSWGAGTVFMFKYPSSGTFGLWCGLCATMTAAYHFINYKDSKEPDRV